MFCMQSKYSTKILNIPHHKQDSNECGLSCVIMATKFFDKKLSKKQIRKLKEKIKKFKGLEAGTLIDIFREKGLVTFAREKCNFRTIIDKINDDYIIIAYIQSFRDWDNHFVVINGYNLNSMELFIKDPESVRRSAVHYSSFIRHWYITESDEHEDSRRYCIFVRKS